MHFIIVITILLLAIGSDGLRNVRLEAKSFFRYGEEAMLRCSYDLELTEALYAVKWYRGQEEFYRFIPKELRSKQVFQVQGILVDYFQSDDHHVLLKNISFKTNGRYKCVVSIDGTFETLEDAKNISIIAIGYDSPRLYLEKQNYNPGDNGSANCSVDRTLPPVNITWFINDKKITNDKVTTLDVLDELRPQLYSTNSMLGFSILQEDTLKIKCLGQLYDVYSEASVITVTVLPGRNKPQTKLNTADSLQHSFASSDFINKASTFHLVMATQILLLTEMLSSISIS